MDDIEKRKLSKLIDRVMQDQDLQSPSADFTKGVMGRIAMVQKSEKWVYRPLIPKKIMFVLAVLFLAVLIWTFSMVDFGNSSWVAQIIGQDLFANIKLPSIDLNFSKGVVYAFVMLGAMFIVQASFLKKYFENRIA